MRLRLYALLSAVLSISVVWLPGVAQASPDSPEAVVAEAYQEWQAALGVRQQCASGVSIVLEPVDGRRGEYRTGDKQVVIDPAGDLDGMAGVVIHELAHHAFLSCGVFAEPGFTEAFYAAQGLPEDRDWFDYSAGWAQTPAEHFAEAVALVVGGGREGGIGISAEAADIVTGWLAGAPIAPPQAATQDPRPFAEGDVSATPPGSALGVDQASDPVPPTSVSPEVATEQATDLATTNTTLVGAEGPFDVARSTVRGVRRLTVALMDAAEIGIAWLRSPAPRSLASGFPQ